MPFSKYTVKTHNIPEYREDESYWIEALIKVLELEKFDLVIPTNDGSMLPLVKERSTLEKTVKLAIPSDAAFYCAYNKSATNELAQRLHVPIPRQTLVSNETDFSKFDSGWKFPLVIKPVSSKVIKNCEIASLSVCYAYSIEQLFESSRNLLEATPVLVQEFFVGTGTGVEFLADKGRILSAFQHVRVHEPMTGGGSSYRKSVPLDGKLLNCVEKIVVALDFTGVAMVEFKCNFETGEFVLIEINSRFWGSLPLSVAAGVDFPYYLYELLVNDKTNFPSNYKSNRYCRNLFRDASWFIHNLKTKPSPYNNAKSLGSILWGPLNILLLREHSDTFVLDDLHPAFVEIMLYCQRTMQGLDRRLKKVLYSSKAFKKVHAKKLRSFHKISSVAFVCKGNICRSPFAEIYAKKSLKERGQGPKIESYGYLPKYNRSCRNDAVEAGNKFGVDLRLHRSKVVSKEALSKFDIIIVFDVIGYIEICSRFPNLKDNIFFLGVASRKPKIEFVEDPYGGDVERFTKTYKSIALLFDMFFEKIIKVTS